MRRLPAAMPQKSRCPIRPLHPPYVCPCCHPSQVYLDTADTRRVQELAQLHASTPSLVVQHAVREGCVLAQGAQQLALRADSATPDRPHRGPSPAPPVLRDMGCQTTLPQASVGVQTLAVPSRTRYAQTDTPRVPSLTRHVQTQPVPTCTVAAQTTRVFTNSCTTETEVPCAGGGGGALLLAAVVAFGVLLTHDPLPAGRPKPPGRLRAVRRAA